MSETTPKVGLGFGALKDASGPGMLADVRVIEIADERAGYTGLLLAGLSAEVVKIALPEGIATRRIRPAFLYYVIPYKRSSY
jgi:crotonobetainyl-CoA:carnitine CoA-transferase CaiB-like acyl-CoA transferase